MKWDQEQMVKTIARLHELSISSDKDGLVIAAPSYNHKNLLRVYMNGGNVGRIALTARNTTTGISADYRTKYKGHEPEEVKILNKDYDADETKRLKALISKPYLDYCREATGAYSSKSGRNKDRERTIETRIMNPINQKSGSAAIDMEMAYSAVDHFGWTTKEIPGCAPVHFNKAYRYNNTLSYTEGITVRPRVDLMVLNDQGVGFVELKVDNESCDNLDGHVEHMNYILDHPDKFIEDADRRINVLSKYGLLDEALDGNLEVWRKEKNIWCGILFVGEEKEHRPGAVELVKNLDPTKLGDIKFSFIDRKFIDAKKIDLSSESFKSVGAFIGETND